MTNPTIKLVNAETGEEIERDMNAEELAQLEKDKAASNAESAVAAALEEQKLAVLKKLGLTSDEVAALLS